MERYMENTSSSFNFKKDIYIFQAFKINLLIFLLNLVLTAFKSWNQYILWSP